jgi:hypothetical protein|tara:strand:- start:161 stop:976 length:816 start_codon:yes stop_codon:yes gene_type:complete
MVKNSKYVEDYNDQDWEQIAEIVPTKDAKKCNKRWLFIQKLGGNKTKWTKKEDLLLVTLITSNGARDWSTIAEKLNDAMLEYVQNPSLDDKERTTFTARNGKQCRERWLTALDPSINKKQWSLKEDIDFLEKWLAVGNKWREIANLIEGRTESQVKNRFKLILRREHIQQNNYDPEELKSVVIPQIIVGMKERVEKGDDLVTKSATNGDQNNYDEDDQRTHSVPSSMQSSQARVQEGTPDLMMEGTSIQPSPIKQIEECKMDNNGNQLYLS